MAAVLAAASYSRIGFSLNFAVHARRVMVPGGSKFHLEPGIIMDMIIQTLNLILLKYAKLHCLCTSIVHNSPLSIFRGGGETYEQKIIYKIIVIEGMAILPKMLHISSTSGDTTLSPLSLYASLLMPSMCHFSW